MKLDDEMADVIAGLDRAFPDGWRSGDRTTDALVVLMARQMRRLTAAIFAGDHR